MKKILTTLLIVSIFISCNEQVLDNQIYQPLESSMIFTSHENFEIITNKVSKMSDQELDSWEQENHFVSYRSIINQANIEFNLISTEEEQKVFLKKYNDILTIKDSTLTSRINIHLYQSIVNREGIYETNGYLNKVVGEYILTVRKENYQKIHSINSDNFNQKNEILKKQGISIFKFTGSNINTNARTNATCSTYMEAEYYDNPSGCRNDRRVYISAKSYVTFSAQSDGDWRQPRVELKVWGTIRNGWCNWSDYGTQLEYRSVSFSLMGWIFQNGSATPTSYSINLVDYSTTYDRTSLPWDQPIGDRVLNQAIYPAAFSSLHAEGSSRGVGYNWAIIDCQ
jgi:hypothetical protein